MERGRALDPAGMGSEPAWGDSSEPAGRASVPFRRTSEPAGMASEPAGRVLESAEKQEVLLNAIVSFNSLGKAYLFICQILRALLMNR